MEKELKILLVEDEPAECRAISQYAENIDGIRLIGVTNSVAKAIEYVGDHLPDAVILDIELHKGSGNGILFLEELHILNPKIMPYILVTTNNTSQITYDKARQLGAGFIMSKYQEDYSAENVIEFLKSMKSVIQRNTKAQGVPDNLLTTEDIEQIAKRILKKIGTEMDLIGISPKMVGRKYLIDSIQIVMVNPIPNICREIAKKYSKSDGSVERAMQNAINVAWRASNIDDLSKNYKARISSEKGVPTSTEFIYYYADKIKNEL